MASSGHQAAATTVSTPDKEQPKFTIPPLTKATETPLAIRRRLDLKRNDSVLTEQLNNLSLQSRTATGSSAAKTPMKTPKKSSAARPIPAAMPSPGLRKIRERLGGDGSGATSSLNSIASRGKEQREADEAAVRAVADAEASAARAIDNVFSQQEGLLAAMSLALKSGTGSGGGGSNSAMQSAVLDKIATAVEEATREQLAALSGVAKEGDEIRSTAVYWITMARFEESHGRVDAARTYLTEGIEHMREGMDCSNNNTTQINALRLALERLDKRVAGGKERAELVASKSKPNKLPPSDSVLPEQPKNETASRKSPARPRRRSIGKSQSPSDATAFTPTRRSGRIKARSAEKAEKPGGN